MNQALLKYLIIPVILFFASIAMIVWVLLPLYNDTYAALGVKDQNAANLLERQKLTANLQKLTVQYNERVSDVAAFEKAIPVGVSMPELLANLEALALENGMIFSGVDSRPKDLKAGAGIKTLVVEIKLKGSYTSLLNYLKALEKSLRLMDAVAVSFSGISVGQTRQGTDQLDFSLTINTYYQ